MGADGARPTVVEAAGGRLHVFWMVRGQAYSHTQTTTQSDNYPINAVFFNFAKNGFDWVWVLLTEWIMQHQGLLG